MTWQPPSLPADHPPVRSGGIGVLLVNLGTPDAPDTKSVKRYLAEFLSDRRVVEIPPLVWQPILRGIILNTRPKKSAEAYSQVWTDKGSPLAAITAEQAMRLQDRLGPGVRVRHAMRYGRPEIGDEMQALIDNASPLAGFGYEITLMRRYVELARQGNCWLIVKVDSDDDAARDDIALRAVGAVGCFGRSGCRHISHVPTVSGSFAPQAVKFALSSGIHILPVAQR